MSKKRSKAVGELEKGSSVVFIMAMIGNVLGVIFQTLSGRVLNDVKLYADLNSILSLHTILILPSSIIIFIISKFVAQFFAKKENEYMKGFLKKSFQCVCVITVSFMAIEIAMSNIFSNALNISNELIILTIILASITILVPVITGTLQGMQLFFFFGIVGLIGQSSKIVAMLVALVVRDKLLAIVIVLIVGMIGTLIYGFIILRRVLSKYETKFASINRRTVLSFGTWVIGANIGLVILNNVDMLLVKHYFDGESGYYSTAMVLGKMVSYFSGAIVIVLFPLAVGAKDDRKKSLSMIKKALSYNFVFSALCMLGLNILGKLIIQILYGDIYLKAFDFILPITMMVLPISMINIILNFFLAIDECRNIVIYIITGAVLEILFVFLFHQQISSVIWMLAGIMWVVFFASLYELYKKVIK